MQGTVRLPSRPLPRAACACACVLALLVAFGCAPRAGTAPAGGAAGPAGGAAADDAAAEAVAPVDPYPPVEGATRIALMNDITGSQGPLGSEADRGARLAFMLHAAAASRAAAAVSELGAGGFTTFDAPSMDTASSGARAAELAEAEAGRSVLGIGFTDSDPAGAAAARFARQGRAFLVVGATDPGLPGRSGAGTFLACFGDDAQARAAADFGRDRFGKRAVVVFDARAGYPRTLAGFFRQRFGGFDDCSVVTEFDLGFVPPERLAPYLSEVARGTDFVFLACEPHQVGPVLAAIRAAMPAVPVVGGDALDCDAVLRTGAAPTDRVWFTTHCWMGEGASPEMRAFVEDYRIAYGVPPSNAFAALGFDAARLVIDARARADSDDPAAVAQALAATAGFRGVTGPIGYADGPVPRKDVWIVEVAEGRRRLAERHLTGTGPTR